MRITFKLRRSFWKLKSSIWKLLNSGKAPIHSTPYYSVNELGEEGRCKEDFANRFAGLEPICNQETCAGASLLDLGCAEGLISREFSKQGVKIIHGFDVQKVSIDGAQKIFSTIRVESKFREADLSDWSSFKINNKDILLDYYDLVLFLGIYHQLKLYSGKEAAENTLEEALKICKGYFAIRTDFNLLPKGIFEKFGFIEIEKDHTAAAFTTARFGPLKIYKYSPSKH